MKAVLDRGDLALDLPAETQSALVLWAALNDAVLELWIFGSRAKGLARPDSDVDIGLALVPAKGKDDWALGAYFALESEWKRELEAIADRRVSLQAMVPDTKADTVVRETGIQLWKRLQPTGRAK